MSAAPPALPQGGNFLRSIIDADLARGTYAGKRWSGAPGDAASHAAAPADPAPVRTRFPPEPNGYLHIGHAKSICLNFGLAQAYGGVCHMRFDDTNPEKEEQEYVDAILDGVRWLGFSWNVFEREHLYYASDYFDFMARAAEALIESGHAYVDEQSAEEMRAARGSLTEKGRDSPWRTRAPADSLARFREMRQGLHAEGSMVLRAKIDMASPNINLRDPAVYRIRKATHHRTGDAWCIYPMYAYAHPIEDALECITHSICTLEFEDQRPFYDWVLARLADCGLLARPLPHQHEFARLNLTYVVTSKRKLKQLVEEKIVSGWDDPRMPTIAGLRRRGYTPDAIRLFCDRIGVSKADSWIDYSTLEIALRDDLDAKAPRAMAVLDPVKLVITNYPGDGRDACSAPRHPHQPEMGERHFEFARELWIEREDFAEEPPKGYHRLFPGNLVRLRYGFVVKCTGCRKDGDGNIIEVHAEYLPETRSGTPGSASVKTKGVITWVGVADAVPAEVRLYERLFTTAQPDAGGRDFRENLNPASLRVVRGYVEPSLAGIRPDERVQFERHGYFVTDRFLHSPQAMVFNRITGLKDTWAK
ncbi:MAG: glutamine--tRNA ligase/YqeY domain fusion protein [Burkholderiales bacterium]